MKSASALCFAALFLFGCGGNSDTKPGGAEKTKESTESKSPPSCKEVCEHLGSTLRRGTKATPADIVEICISRCTDVTWSTEKRSCYMKVSGMDDMKACKDLKNRSQGADNPKYMRRAKTTEAIDNLDKIYKGAAFYYTTPRVSRDGRKLPCQLPADQVVTPPGKTCCGSLGSAHDQDKDGRCDVDPQHWSSATWAALNFQINDQHYFTYEFDSNGKTLSEARFTASAYADLDCDGVFSTFQRLGYGDPGATMAECALRGASAFYVENETE